MKKYEEKRKLFCTHRKNNAYYSNNNFRLPDWDDSYTIPNRVILLHGDIREEPPQSSFLELLARLE